MENKLKLSSLAHTWVIDLDGTLVKHNGYLSDGVDCLLPGAKEFMDSLPEKDFILIVTSRKEEYRKTTINFLNDNGIRFNEIIFGLPYGERILINDDKPSGLTAGFAVNKRRDSDFFPTFFEDDSI